MHQISKSWDMLKISFLQKAFLHKDFKFENTRWISQCFRLYHLNANGVLNYTWPWHGEPIPLKLKLELCETSKFLQIIICTSDTIFPVNHSRGSSYNLMYWRSLNGKIRLIREENILFQVFNIPSQSSYWISIVYSEDVH